MNVVTKCQECGKLVEIEETELARVQAMPLYGSQASVVCGNRCDAIVTMTRSLIGHGWALTPPMLRQEARA